MIEIIDKKLREARYALEKMRKQEAKAFGDKEPFDFLLSAFLTVTTSACDAAIDKWTAIWKDGLSPEEERLYNFMRKNRGAEVHGRSSSRTVKQDVIQVGGGGVYSDESRHPHRNGQQHTRLGHGRSQYFQAALLFHP